VKLSVGPSSVAHDGTAPPSRPVGRNTWAPRRRRVTRHNCNESGPDRDVLLRAHGLPEPPSRQAVGLTLSAPDLDDPGAQRGVKSRAERWSGGGTWPPLGRGQPKPPIPSQLGGDP
jgi:hypothetical protein